MNKVELTGRIVRDAEVRYTNETPSIAIARFTIAVDRRIKREGQQNADFIRCVAFGKTAEFMAEYGKKGVKFEVVGRIQTGNYTDREGRKINTTEVVCEELNFAESKTMSEKNSNAATETTGTNDGFMQIPDGIDDELPFS